MRHALLLIALLSTPLMAAQVYRYTDDKGVVHYTDKPPSKDAAPTALPPIQTFKSEAPPAKKAEDPAAAAKKPVAKDFSLSIESPTPDETFRGTNTSITISVRVMPGLVSGYGLIYYVDGAPQNQAPSSSTQHAVQGLERGSHELAAALVDAKGVEQARSSVTVHLHSPSAIAKPPSSLGKP